MTPVPSPSHDPSSQADVSPGARGVRAQIDELVRTAAPRLGKVAVARIAGPLTEAVIALREELRATHTFEPVTVGEVITTEQRLGQACLDTAIRDARGLLCERDSDVWHCRGSAIIPQLPARVVDVPEAT